MDIICKNPGMSDEGEDSTVLLAHDRVIGAIIERGDITPRRIHDMRVAAKKPTLPIFFVSFGSGRVWAERTANAIKADSYQEMSVSYSAEGEYESSETILAPITT